MAYGAIIGALGSSSSSSDSGGGGLFSNIGVGQKLMGAAANLAGAFLGQTPDNPGGQILPFSDPTFNAALQAAQFDALNQIGFGDISAIPSPVSQLINRITALPIENRLKRRAIVSIQAMMRGKKPTRGDALGETLTQLGMEKRDIQGLRERQAQYDEQMAKLSGLRGINTDTVMQRAMAANQASKMLGAAGQFATGGAPSDFQSQIRNSLSRNLDQQEEQLMLRAQYGGFNPGASLERITDQRLDLDLRALEKSLAAASGISSALGLGTAGAQNAGNSSISAFSNSLGMASQQALAANQIMNSNAQYNTSAMANGIASAINSLSPLSGYGGGTKPTTGNSTGTEWDSGDVYNPETSQPGGNVDGGWW